MTTVLYDEFTGTNGSAPNATTFVASVTGTGSVVDIQSNQLRFLGGTTNPSEARAICRDASGTNFALADFDIYALIDPGGTLQQQFFALIARTTNDWDAGHVYMPTSGYACEVDPSTPANLSIYKHVSGVYTAIASGSFTWTASTKSWCHFQGRGTALRCRLWNNGSDPPSSWAIDTTDSSLTSGGIQLRNHDNSGANRTTAIDTTWVDDGKQDIPPWRRLLSSPIYCM